MDPVKNIKDLVLAINNVSYDDGVHMEFFVAQVKDVLRQVFTPASQYLMYVNSIQFRPISPWASVEESVRTWARAKKQLRDLLLVALDDQLLRNFESWDEREIRELIADPQAPQRAQVTEYSVNSSLMDVVAAFKNRVKVDLCAAQEVNAQTFSALSPAIDQIESFGPREMSRIRIDLRDLHLMDDGVERFLVHSSGFRPRDNSKKILFVPGSDDRANDQVRRFLNTSEGLVVGLEAAGGQEPTLAELLAREGAFKIAVILLSGDCWFRARNDGREVAVLSPAPSVCFKLGFLISRMGRDKVVVVCEDSARFRRPTDYFEALYVAMTSSGTWRNELTQRLRDHDVSVRDKTHPFFYQS